MGVPPLCGTHMSLLKCLAQRGDRLRLSQNYEWTLVQCITQRSRTMMLYGGFVDQCAFFKIQYINQLFDIVILS